MFDEGENGLSETEASEVYAVLVEYAGASERSDPRHEFIYHQTARFCPEFRFMGSLGFGGKFRRDHDRWLVTAYPEDTTEERFRILQETNAALEDLQERLGRSDP